MLSTLPTNMVAILSQTSLTIGLFEYYRIVQSVGSVITWIKPTQNPLSAWVRPRTLVTPAYYGTDISETLNIFCDPTIRLNTIGEFDTSYIHTAVLHKLSYNVSFYENDREYPLFTVTPDDFLPWNFTFHTSNTIRHIQQQPMRHYRLQNIPLTPTYMAFLTSTANIVDPSIVHPRPVLKDDDICPISLELLTKETVYWTPCNHGFSLAIKRALEEDPRCPLCRAICYFSECEKST